MVKGYDSFGNIVVLKFAKGDKLKDKKKFAESYLKKNKSVRTVLEKIGKFSGRLRTLKTKHLAGEKNLEALYRESDCNFRFNVESCYFSSRLSNERIEIAEQVKRGEDVLVMFGGVAPFAIVIAKNSKAKKIVSVELGREPSKYAKENVKRNKFGERIEIVQGNVRKVKLKGKFNRIVMARPNLKDSFLDVALPLIKKKGIMHYYGFRKEDDKDEMLEMIEDEAKKAKKRIKILKVKKAGEIGMRKFRYRVDIKVL
tara:strand:+ start:78 stop:845 length:768 start_codon:yes stop_codon:yes gene_type:complete